MKITSQILSEKLADYVTDKTGNEIGGTELLDAVPELKQFDPLARQIEKTCQATALALSYLLDGEDRFELESLRDELHEVYLQAVGEPPAEYDNTEDDYNGYDDE